MLMQWSNLQPAVNVSLSFLWWTVAAEHGWASGRDQGLDNALLPLPKWHWHQFLWLMASTDFLQ